MPTLREFVESWLEDPARPGRTSEGTATLYAGSARSWLLGSAGAELTAIPVDRVHPQDVTAWLARVARKGGLPTARTARSVLNAIFAQAIARRLVSGSPVRDATLAGAVGRPREKGRPGPSPELDPERALSRGERERLLAAARRLDADTGVDLCDLLLFLAGTGVRIGEALATHWDELSVGQADAWVWVELGHWTIRRRAGVGIVRAPHGHTKEAVRRFALPTPAGEAMRARMARHGATPIVFPSPLDPQGYREVSDTTKRLRQLFNSVIGDDGLPLRWASSHSLRRSLITDLHLAGTPTRAIADHTGHRNLRVIEEHYIARTPSSSLVAEMFSAPQVPLIAPRSSDGDSDEGPSEAVADV